MKKLILIITSLLLNTIIIADDYGKQLNRIQDDMEDFGIKVGVFGQSPFQTGTSLSNYFIDEKTLILARDTFFQMKANDLKTTEQVADFQHRTKVLRMHAQNLTRQMIGAIKERNREGFIDIEAPKHEEVIEDIEKECNADATCMADRLDNPETNVENILLDNFALATNVFEQIPAMHAIEVQGVNLLINQIYAELIYVNNLLSSVEYNIFYKKQKKLLETIKKNPLLTKDEVKLQTLMIDKMVKSWKLRILQRKYDAKDEFKTLALDLKEENKKRAKELKEIRDNKDVFGEMYTSKYCRWFLGKRKRKWCDAYDDANDIAKKATAKKDHFLAKEEMDLPAQFWGKEETQDRIARKCHLMGRNCRSKNLISHITNN